jgi:hypothetical protein
MSVFQVTLNNINEGQMDLQYNATYPHGTPMTTSLQRTIYINGPHRVNRELKDGMTFTDCNYYKQFCLYDPVLNPQGCTQDKVILTCISDDGSIWDEVDNTSGAAPLAFAATGTSYSLNVLSTYGAYATFCQISNFNGTTGQGANEALVVTLNGGAAVFSIPAGSDQLFDKGDLLIGSISLALPSGASSGSVLNAQILLGVTPLAST